MRWRVWWAVVGLLFLAIMPAHAEVGPQVKVNDLIEHASEFDGKSVTVEGEVIGDVMVRGTNGWINVTDGTNDIGVWAPSEALRQIQLPGRYHYRGDTVRVTGEFRRADPEHGGDLTLRAATLKVLAPGGRIEHQVQAGRPLLAVITLGVASILGYLRFRARAAARAKADNP